MALERNSLHAGTMTGWKVDMNAMEKHFDILCSLYSALRIAGISVCLEALWLVSINTSQPVNIRNRRCNLVIMSH